MTSDFHRNAPGATSRKLRWLRCGSSFHDVEALKEALQSLGHSPVCLAVRHTIAYQTANFDESLCDCWRQRAKAALAKASEVRKP
jgi:hypothetical protein